MLKDPYYQIKLFKKKMVKKSLIYQGYSGIWQALNKSVKTSEMLELNKPPALKTVIDGIFT
ncbi:MAG: hypothetical protein ACXAAI_16305 [Promethearchaeota archaeon]